MTQPLTDEQLAAIQARRDAYLASHNHMGAFACCSAHASADDVPALLGEIHRLRAERETYRAAWHSARDRAVKRTAERDAALERLANYGTPLRGPSAAPSVDQGAIKKAAVRDELERTGVTPWEWAVGRGLCPERTGCPSGLLAVFQLTKRGRLPVHSGDYGPACGGSSQRPSVVLRAADPTTT